MSFADDDTQPISMPLTSLDLDAIEARAKAATTGPWKADLDVFTSEDGIEACVTDDEISMLVKIGTDIRTDGLSTEKLQSAWALARQGQELRDATFIAHARADIPALVSRVRELTALLLSAQADRDALLSSVHDRESFDRLLARSSLGTPGAVAVRASADREAVAKILARVAELEADGMTPDGERMPGTYCGEWNGPCYRMLLGTCPNCGRTR